MKPSHFVTGVAPLAGALMVAACQPSAGNRVAPATADSGSIMRDVRHLASDLLEGRRTGTAGNDSAAAYIARRFASLGLSPLAAAGAPSNASGAIGCSLGRGRQGTDGGCEAAYRQPFVARSAAMAHTGGGAELPTSNVVALLPGSDERLRTEYVVLGAHFDHLGRSSVGSLDASAGSAIHNGADDNASGTAVVLELARLLRQRAPRRSIVFALFSGEELGLLGSRHFVELPVVPLDGVRAMLNFDMVGRLRDDRLIVYGVETAREWRVLLDSANSVQPFRIAGIGDGFGPSDHASFYMKNIPVLHFFTDVHDDYHKPTDDSEKVNGSGVARVAALAERLVRAVADRPGSLTFNRATAAAPARGSRTGSGTYFGSVPDMAATDTTGLRISGVRPGSPADKAGLVAGDVIVEFAGKPVKDLNSYSDALYAQKPGDVVSVVVLRAGSRVTLRATLGSRGG